MAQCHRFTPQHTKLLTSFGLGGPHEVVENVRRIEKVLIELPLLVRNVVTIQAIPVDKMVSALDQQGLPFLIGRGLAVRLGSLQQNDPWPYSLQGQAAQRRRL